MGFWVSLFNAEYERVLWKPLRRAFPFLPKRERQRKSISTPLNMIRSLRNRVFHHEAICWNLHRLCLLHETIIRTVGWLNPMLPLWLKRIDRFDCVVRENHNQHWGGVLGPKRLPERKCERMLFHGVSALSGTTGPSEWGQNIPQNDFFQKIVCLFYDFFHHL